jgi:HEAT repeat protein
MTPDQRQCVLAKLRGNSWREANDAAQAIWQEPDPALVRDVIAILQDGDRVYNRVEAAYALRVLSGEATTMALERTLTNRAENPRVRAFAAEGLADSHRSASHDVLLRTLRDPSAQVRFWCAFALGKMHDERALPILQRLASTDKRIVRGWWSVSKEARDAIEEMQRPFGIPYRRSVRRRCPYCCC